MVSAVPEQQQQQYSLFPFILVYNSNEINFDFSLTMARFHYLYGCLFNNILQCERRMDQSHHHSPSLFTYHYS